MDGQQWWGDLPTWISTAAIGFAALTYFSERGKRAHERDLEEKSRATRLSAWVVTDAEAKPRESGVLIANDSGATFHSVEIVAMIHKQVQPPIRLVTLPPGHLFVPMEHERGGGRFAWRFGILPSEYQGVLRPYTVSDGYLVQSMEFSDNLSQRWRTDEHGVLRRVESSR